MINKISDLELKYKFYRRIYNEKILKSINNKDYILLIEIELLNKHEIKNEIEKIKKRLFLKHNNLCQILDYSTIIIEDGFKNIYKIRKFYEFAETNLKRKIKRYKKYNIHFSLEQIFNFIYDILSVLIYLQKNNKLHGDLKPDYIINDENSCFKLIDRIKNRNNFPKNLYENFMNKEKLYISPELYNSFLIKNKDFSNLNYYKNEIYSLGLIILEMGLLTSIQPLYKNIFDYNLLNKYIIEFSNKYNNKLLDRILNKLLESNYEIRLDYINLQKIIPTYNNIKLLFNLEKENYKNLNKPNNHKYNLDKNINYNRENLYSNLDKLNPNKDIIIDKSIDITFKPNNIERKRHKTYINYNENKNNYNDTLSKSSIFNINNLNNDFKNNYEVNKIKPNTFTNKNYNKSTIFSNKNYNSERKYNISKSIFNNNLDKRIFLDKK